MGGHAHGQKNTLRHAITTQKSRLHTQLIGNQNQTETKYYE